MIEKMKEQRYLRLIFKIESTEQKIERLEKELKLLKIDRDFEMAIKGDKKEENKNDGTFESFVND